MSAWHSPTPRHDTAIVRAEAQKPVADNYFLQQGLQTSRWGFSNDCSRASATRHLSSQPRSQNTTRPSDAATQLTAGLAASCSSFTKLAKAPATLGPEAGPDAPGGSTLNQPRQPCSRASGLRARHNPTVDAALPEAANPLFPNRVRQPHRRRSTAGTATSAPRPEPAVGRTSSCLPAAAAQRRA